jgi:hypothetical protein
MTNKINRSVFVEGREWFDKSAGNSYFSYRLWIDGEIVHIEESTYGYESAYEYDAILWLMGSDYLPDTFKGSRIWHVKRDLGVDGYASIKEVRKRDLFKKEVNR